MSARRRMAVRDWARDLALGLRFGATGGREGWTRTVLTALGVGVGVATLLFAASVPRMVENQDDREESRYWIPAAAAPAVPTDSTVVLASANTEYRDVEVTGDVMRADGADPVLPPGVERIPGPGEMVVSPALAELLRSADGKALADRLDHRIVGTVGEQGLLDPGELRYYLGSSTLTVDNGGTRVEGYGMYAAITGLNPVLVILIVFVCVVLLVPVAIFVATAVRFGGERRDRRLAALRLVGADVRMTRRIAAGEALFGALLGLAFGIGLFAVVRASAASFRLFGMGAFPSDVVPLPALGALVVVAVPAAAVGVTLFALRTVTIEPLGVVRHTGDKPRRLWWRLLLPAAGLALLLVSRDTDRPAGTDAELYAIAAGAVLVLIGLTTLLPWLVEALVKRFTGGPVPWQLAVRRLQLSGGTAARAVSGVMVAVAGAIALQMLFAGVEVDFEKSTGADLVRAQLVVRADRTTEDLATRMAADLRGTQGVRAVNGTVEGFGYSTEPAAADTAREHVQLIVGDCAHLRELAAITSCADGDTFEVRSADPKRGGAGTIDGVVAKGGQLLLADPDNEGEGAAGEGRSAAPAQRWTLPADTETVTARRDPVGNENLGIYATPGAIDVDALPRASARVLVQVDDSVADARENVRATAARIDPAIGVTTIQGVETDSQYADVRTGLLIGSVATMLLIAASMLVSQIEQLRERRRLLSVLVAFGTRRSTMAWSVLWQTAVPVVLGTALAVAGGLVLGATMLRLVGREVGQWWVFLPVAGAGLGVVLAVTALSTPPLYRMMRPEGLRTE
ncbi:FtsX-like permease family protein [Streptomyces sp. NPDC047315]|uniref:FtsX-like permease family protein n=1 Tax=Streptomyces sp. NPDC047315 TaxID=3155142 RepID=UPI0033C92E03